MKRTLLLIFCGLLTLCIHGQIQRGYVKTRGRMASDGKVIAGKRLPGAVVSVRGRNAVISGNRGDFSLSLAGSSYILQSVQKFGYILNDPDILSRTYTLSSSPLVLVLTTEAEQLDDRLMARDRIKSTLQEQLRKREAEIKRLKEQNKINKEEFDRLFQTLDIEEANNTKLISKMAERYSKIDYDQLDEFNRKVSEYILNGELMRADSLINSKGDIKTRVQTLRQLQRANAEEEQALAKRRKKLEESKEQSRIIGDDLANDCYSKYEIFMLQHRLDSAGYYIEKRTEVDSTKIDWLLIAGNYCQEYLVDYSKAESYYRRAEGLMQDSLDFVMVYNNIATLYYASAHYHQSIEYYQKALLYFSELQQRTSPIAPIIYSNLANSYMFTGDYEKALKCGEESVELSTMIYGEADETTCFTMNNLGLLLCRLQEYDQAMAYLKKVVELTEQNGEKQKYDLATYYNNLGRAYSGKKDYDSTLVYYNKSLKLRKELYGENHPNLANIYNNIGAALMYKGEIPEALEQYGKAVEIWSANEDTRHRLIEPYGNIATCYEALGDKVKALENYEKGQQVAEHYLSKDDQDATLFLPHIYIVLSELAQTSEAYRSRFVSYMDDKMITAFVPKGMAASPASQSGMAGTYFILSYTGWDIDSPTSYFANNAAMQGKPKDVVFMQDGVIIERHFDNMIGASMGMTYMSKEDKTRIRQQYHEWKSAHE